MTIELASGKEIHSDTCVENLTFKLETEPTHCYLRVLALGVYDGILGMNWLTQNQESIHCG